MGTRPTADRTRETLFSMLASRMGDFADLSVCDAFAGSGALGLESLSRGAARCMFIEQDAAALRALRKNIANLRAADRCDVRAASVFALGPAQDRAFDLVLLDPPYESAAGEVAVDKLKRLGWIAPSTWVALETGKDRDVAVRGFTADAVRDVGKARLTILRPS